MVSIVVCFSGDPSVGIFPATWEIPDIPMPRDEIERRELRHAFTCAFDYVTGGGHSVYFSDELQEVR